MAKVDPPPRTRRRSTGLAAALWVGLCLLALLYTFASRPSPRASADRSTGGYLIHLNDADAAELTLLPGIGPKSARHIVSHRERHGGFTSVDQLDEVHLIGPKTIAKLRPYVTLGL